MASEAAKEVTPAMPFDVCGAMSQGYIGYHIQQCLMDAMQARGLNKQAVTLLTQVVVDQQDPCFQNPSKPIGRFYTQAEAEAIRQKGLAEAEAMKQKAEAYKQYNDAAVAEMMIKVLPEIARSVAQPLSSIDKVSIIGGDASGVSGVSGNVPVLMAQTMEAMKEATGIDMRDIVRANSIEAKTDRNITIKTEPEGEA